MNLFHPKHKKFAIICGMDKTMVAITRLKVYLESTISSYYVALPSSSAVNAERQAYTIKWHETCTHINNPIMLPSIITQVALAGYKCPQIMTPREFLEVYNAIL